VTGTDLPVKMGKIDGIHEYDLFISVIDNLFLHRKRKVLICSKPVAKRGGHKMQFAEWTYPLRKFDDIYYTIERIVYGKGELKGFTTEDIYNNLRDKRFFQDAQDLNRYLLNSGAKYKIRKIEGTWERYY
jgi:hypothetical protein